MANLKDLIVRGVSRFIGKVYIDDSDITIINGSTVGDYPKFTDTTYDLASSTAPGLMSTAQFSKLDGIATGAEVNVQANWTESSTTSDAYIKNKPSIPTALGTVEIRNKVISGWGSTITDGDNVSY